VKIVQILLWLLLILNSSFGQNKIFDSLIYQLQIIDRDDQTPRIQLDSIRKQYSNDSSLLRIRLETQWKTIRNKDSINVIKVIAILDKYGWLGPDDVGDDGNTTLFLVIQHANLNTQEKYLPLMKAAVKNGKAKARNFAFLQDRIALREGKKQIYGTQVFQNIKTNECFVLPLDDPYNVDIKRAEVGLQPLSVYLEDNFKTKWDVAQYLKDLPFIEATLKANHL
jgi:hypothetical protein